MPEPTLREELAIVNLKLDMLLEMKTDIKTIQLECPRHGLLIQEHSDHLKAHSETIAQMKTDISSKSDAEVVKQMQSDIATIYSRLWAGLWAIVLLFLSASVGMLVKGWQHITALADKR